MTAYAYAEQPFVRPPELDGGTTEAPVAIVGAGPIGLAMAIDLAQRGVASVVLDDNNVVSVGSRAICWAKRTLEIFDRLGVGERMLEKGVTWKVGRNFPRRRAGLRLRPSARGRAQVPGLREPAAILRRGIPAGPRAGVSRPHRHALPVEGHGSRGHGRWRAS
jgi:hypothetical protein